jgi:hypothetical protein
MMTFDFLAACDASNRSSSSGVHFVLLLLGIGARLTANMFRVNSDAHKRFLFRAWCLAYLDLSAVHMIEHLGEVSHIDERSADPAVTEMIRVVRATPSASTRV